MTNTTSADDKEKALSAARSAAAARLREAHREEFEGYLVDEAKQRGVEWKPRKTAKQRAEEQFQALLAEFPDLAKSLSGPETSVPQPETERPQPGVTG